MAGALRKGSMGKAFFDQSLQAFLERRFGIRAEILDHVPDTDAPAIAFVADGSSGGSWGDLKYTWFVQLCNGPFTLRLNFDVHQESNQIDWWEVQAGGVMKDAVEELTALCDPRQYTLHWCNNDLEPRIRIQAI
jgi:hypothetical protein